MDKETIIANKKTVIAFGVIAFFMIVWALSSGAPEKTKYGKGGKNAQAQQDKQDKQDKDTTTRKAPKDRTDVLELRRKHIAARLEVLEKMTQKQWEDEGKKLGKAAAKRPETLELAIKANKDRLAKVDADIKAASKAKGATKDMDAADKKHADKAAEKADKKAAATDKADKPAEKKGKKKIVDEDDDDYGDEGQ